MPGRTRSGILSAIACFRQLQKSGVSVAEVTLSETPQPSYSYQQMSDKQVFAAIIGGFVSAVLGGLLIIPITLLAHADGGDDGWGLIWWMLMIVSGVVGFVFAAKWARTHINE